MHASPAAQEPVTASSWPAHVASQVRLLTGAIELWCCCSQDRAIAHIGHALACSQQVVSTAASKWQRQPAIRLAGIRKHMLRLSGA